MTKKVKSTVFAAVCVISALILAFSFSRHSPDAENQTQTATQSTVYTVADYHGKIAVFRNQEKTPIEVYDSYVSSFPEHDRELLKNGIHAENESELQRIIEDYTS